MKTLALFRLLILFFLVGVCSPSVHATTIDYQIGPGDVLRIDVYDHPDLSTVARVDTEGAIIFPLAGRILLGSMTTSEAADTLARKLDGDYIINPQVSIFIEEFRSKKVVIIGEVVRPGLYELSGPTTLLELISKAGGLTRSAGQTATIRRSKTGESTVTNDIVVNVTELLNSGATDVDVSLIDGDSITIAKAGVVYVTGQVNRPAAYPMEPGATVIKVVTMAGGFTPLAAQNKVKIIRKISGREQVLEKVSLYEVLKEDDVLVVPESFF